MICVNRKRAVFPATPSQRQEIRLSPLDLPMFFFHYIQKGLLYQTPAENFSSQVDLLAQKLSFLLVKFYPLAGRFKTSTSDGAVYIDCNDSGVDFIEATAGDLSIADVTTAEVTQAVEQLFALNGAVNLDGHRLPLLAVQIQTSNAKTDSLDKNPFKGGEHGTGAPRTSKDYQESIMTTMHLMTSKDINWNVLAPIMAYKIIPCNANGKYVISLKMPNRP